MKKIFGLMMLICLFSIFSIADEPIPPTPKPTNQPKKSDSIDTRLYISIRRDAKEARLIIPKSQLKQLRAELEQLDGENDATAAISTGNNFARTQTIVGGLFLSLAFVFGGVWFARSRQNSSKTSKTVAVGAVLFLSGAFAAIAFANAGPPPEARSITGKMFTDAVHMYKQGSGEIKLEVSDDNYLQLIVPDAPKENRAGEN